MDTNTAEQLREVVDYWLLSVRAAGAAKDTVASYREHSKLLLRHIGDGDGLTPFTIRRFLVDYGEGHANASLRTVFISLRAFIRFGVREGLLPETLLTGLKAPKRIESPKQVYTPGQLRALFAMLEGNRSPLGLRDHALVCMLADGGLRASEATNLTLDKLTGDGVLRIGPSKSGRMRSVPLGRTAVKALNRYLAVGRPRLKPKGEAVLVGLGGEAICRNTVRLILTRLSKRVGFPVSAHKFRHTWATTMLRRGCDLETLRQIGGWRDYEMLLTYTHLADADLRQAVAKFSPLDGL
jgi:site-specific recombinase XerD